MFIKKTHFWVFFIRENAYNFATVNQLSILYGAVRKKSRETLFAASTSDTDRHVNLVKLKSAKIYFKTNSEAIIVEEYNKLEFYELQRNYPCNRQVRQRTFRD